MELKIILEFAIALTIAPLTFCWAIDLAHLIQAVHRGELDKFADYTNKTVNTTTAIPAAEHLAIAPDTQTDTQTDTEPTQDHLLRPLYTSKAVIHRVSEGYVEKLGELGALYKPSQPLRGAMADHLAALGLFDKQLTDLTAIQLRKLGARMKIKGAARGRKKDLLKAIRGPHNYA
ncbi:MAG: hypothetical protein EYR95_17380 [Phormidium sp. SL48-SHIP]|nr:MAG: hypothetical protein EYR95_17380 [Phormidium sp. SL48-SHIP]